MANELNQLLTEAAAKCVRLSGQLDEALAGLQSVESGAEAVGDLLEDGTGEIRTALVALTERMVEARTQIEEARAEARTQLDAVAEKAAEVAKEIGALEDAVTTAADELEESVGETRATITAHLATTTAAFDALGEAAAEVSRDSGENLRQTDAAFRAFADSMRGEQEALNERTEAWASALDGLSEEGTRQVNEAVEAMGAVLLSRGREIFDLGNEMVTSHNEAMEALETQIVDGGEKALEAALGPLRDELAQLASVADTRRGELGERAQEVLTRIEGLLPEITEMTRTLQRADRL